MPRPARPARSYATDAVTRAVRLLSLVAVAGVAAWLLLLYPSLPQVLPTHFDFTGTADAWGDKSSVLGLIAVFVAMAALIGWLSAKPRWFNYPMHVTEQNAQRVYREGERMMVWMLVPIAALFAGIALSLVGLPGAILLGLGTAGMFAVLVAGLVRLLKAA